MISQIVVDTDQQKLGVGVRLLQQSLWRLIDDVPDLQQVAFIDISHDHVTSHIGRKFLFEKDKSAVGDMDLFVKELSIPGSFRDAQSLFGIDAIKQVLLGKNRSRLNADQIEKVEAFLSQGNVDAVTAKVDLTMIPIFLQGSALWAARNQLPEMWKGISFYKREVPLDPEQLEKFQWGDFGLILEDADLDQPIPDKKLPSMRIHLAEIATLDPMDLLARIYRNVLGIPPQAEDVRAVLFTDSEGNARLILLYV